MSLAANDGGGGGGGGGEQQQPQRVDGAARRLMRLGNIGPPQRRPVTKDEVQALQQEVASLREAREEDQDTIADLRTDVDALSYEVEVLSRQLAALMERERQRVRRDQDAPGPLAAAERARMPAGIDAPVSRVEATATVTPMVATAAAATKHLAAAEEATSLPRLPKSIV